MNDAHLHMVVNHFPIIGIILGFGILVTGLFLKNNSVKNTAYCLFIVGAIFAAVSMATGEGAEEIAEKLPGVTDQIIETHEEMAEKLAIVLYALGFVSLIGLFLNFKKHSKAVFVSYIAVIIAVVCIFLGKQTGTTGGEIRHTEIRENTTFQNNVISVENETKTDDD
ncbi:MAG TPA: hypothetical protein PLL09_12955 [Flavobacterium sp.]|uniref:hypothetical protein n=1 Tax=unclassified Flavobacterium TaxID=196869 RepID=UPI0025C4A465|nr:MULTISPECIES: hypothetical protein [unclassified Flavobacterium]HRE78719.1 hypothetical protein [Flavobacterium sp.]